MCVFCKALLSKFTLVQKLSFFKVEIFCIIWANFTMFSVFVMIQTFQYYNHCHMIMFPAIRNKCVVLYKRVLVFIMPQPRTIDTICRFDSKICKLKHANIFFTSKVIIRKLFCGKIMQTMQPLVSKR